MLLSRLSERIRKKKPLLKKIILQHDNARPHVAQKTKKFSQNLGWETLAHPPYSPDLAASNFHLF